MIKLNPKKISAQKLSYIFALIAILSSCFVVISIYITTNNLTQLRKISNDKFIAETASKNFKNSANYLNHETWLYLVTKDPIHMQNYIDELSLNKSQEESINILSNLYLTNIERSSILTANKIANKMFNLQIQVLRLTSEAIGLSPNQMPKLVRDFPLSDFEQNLPNSKKLEFAKDLFFNLDYQEGLNNIHLNIDNFSTNYSSRLNRESEGTTLSNLNALKIALVNISLVVFLVLLVTYLCFKFIFKPLAYYDKTLLNSKDNENIKLEARGSLELKNLAHAFNKVATSLKSKTKILKKQLQHRQTLEEFSETVLFHGNIETSKLIFTEQYKNIYGSTVIHFNDPKVIEKIKARVHPDDVNSILNIPNNIKNGRLEENKDYRLLNSNGTYTWNNIKYKVVLDENKKPNKIYGRIINIDERKRTINKLKELVTLDLHSGLLNHVTTFNRIDSFLKSEKGKNNSHALLGIDIDDFKNINDTLGHQMGDFVIKKISDILLETFNPKDIVGRIGGDEFMVLIKNQPGETILKKTIASINHKFHHIKSPNKDLINISASIGVAIYNKDEQSFEELFKKADQSQYNVKSHNKDSFQIYNHT